MTARIVTPSQDAKRHAATRGSVAEERAPDADQRRTLLDGDPPVLRRSHRELGKPEVVGELAQPPEPRSRRLGIVRERRHGHEAAERRHSLNPRREVIGGDAGLRRLSREVHLEERRHGQPPRGRLGVE